MCGWGCWHSAVRTKVTASPLSFIFEWPGTHLITTLAVLVSSWNLRTSPRLEDSSVCKARTTAWLSKKVKVFLHISRKGKLPPELWVPLSIRYHITFLHTMGQNQYRKCCCLAKYNIFVRNECVLMKSHLRTRRCLRRGCISPKGWNNLPLPFHFSAVPDIYVSRVTLPLPPEEVVWMHVGYATSLSLASSNCGC